MQAEVQEWKAPVEVLIKTCEERNAASSSKGICLSVSVSVSVSLFLSRSLALYIYICIYVCTNISTLARALKENSLVVAAVLWGSSDVLVELTWACRVAIVAK